MSKRIEFKGWVGRKNSGITIKWPKYAMQADTCPSAANSVVEAIARKNKLQVVTFRSDGVSEGRPQYQATLGRPVSTGGWTPEAEIWFTLYL